MTGTVLPWQRRGVELAHLIRRPRLDGRRRTLLLAGLFGVLAVAGWLLLGSGLFLARQLQVVGVHRLTVVEVRRAAALSAGTPLALVQTGAVEARIARLPAVAKVRVVRVWPRGLRIEVTERKPLLAVPQPAGYLLVDRTGLAFAMAAKLPAGLTLAALATPRPADPATEAAIQVLAAMPPRLRSAMARLEATSPDAVTLVLRDGRRVVWGGPDRSADKALALASLLRRPGRTYDVSAADVVTVRG